MQGALRGAGAAAWSAYYGCRLRPTCTCGGQSFGFGTKLALHMHEKGTSCRLSRSPAKRPAGWLQAGRARAVAGRVRPVAGRVHVQVVAGPSCAGADGRQPQHALPPAVEQRRVAEPHGLVHEHVRAEVTRPQPLLWQGRRQGSVEQMLYDALLLWRRRQPYGTEAARRPMSRLTPWSPRLVVVAQAGHRVREVARGRPRLREHHVQRHRERLQPRVLEAATVRLEAATVRLEAATV